MTDDLKDAVERVKAVTLPHLEIRRSGSAAARLDAKAVRTILDALLALLSTREVIDLSSGQSTRGSTGAGGEAVPSAVEVPQEAARRASEKLNAWVQSAISSPADVRDSAAAQERSGSFQADQNRDPQPSINTVPSGPGGE